MGEVYRAKDTKLGRDVALKILPASFTNDPERIARFRREAQVLASLNHPHIAQIHGLEEVDGTQFLVLELVDGESLDHRIARGPIPVDEALGIAKQIAEALEAAHEKGIIHRDLKPANIALTKDGTVKVLDFGLAKAVETTGGPSFDAMNSPTITSPAMMTGIGVILGTAAYMSPEQARGKPVDKRTDIWAFGVVLWEMLTGKRAFEGETVPETLIEIATKEPDWKRIPSAPGRQVERLLRRCLEKDPTRRLRDIGEARFLLEEVPPGSGPLEAQGQGERRWLWPVVAALLFVITASVSFFHFREAPPQKAVLRYTIAQPEISTLHSFALSPDGKLLAITGAVNGRQQLWLRPLDVLQGELMPTTEGAQFPFWSPDSRSIGFFAQGKLKKIAASGGPAQLLCDVGFGIGGTWNRDDIILFSTGPDASGSLKRVQAAGGTPAAVMRARQASYPQFLPGGRRFLYTLNSASPESAGIYLSSLDGGEDRRILADVSSVLFAPVAPGSRSGFLVFSRENTLKAQPFDASSGQLSGHEFSVAEGVASIASPNLMPASISESGILLYARGGVGFQMVWYDRAGKLLGSEGSPGTVFTPAISHDEKSIAYARLGSGGAVVADIWLRDVSRGIETRFTADPSGNYAPLWSPRGDSVVWVSSQRGSLNLYQKPSDGSGKDQALLPPIPAAYPITSNRAPSQWSKDGRFIVYAEAASNGKLDLWVLPVGPGDRKPFTFLKTEFEELHGQLSPDSHWMAYASDETGRREVYVRRFPSGEGVWRISVAGGDQPRWRGDGKELFYVAADGKMMAASVRAVPDSKPFLELATPVALFDSHILKSPGTSGVFQYDVTADGKRFLVVANNVAASSPPLIAVVNWAEGSKK
jgi:Tol biopolymer transport system component